MMSMVPNRPTPEGRMLGTQLARLADEAEAESITRFPDTRVRCRTCAFRAGTIPNGCLATVMDALKCVMEDIQFSCHEHTSEPCMGWMEAANRVSSNPLQTPWDFSYTSEEEPP